MTTEAAPPLCPTPAKRRYATREAADQRSRLWCFTLTNQTETYLCPCGWWHARSTARAEARRARLRA